MSIQGALAGATNQIIGASISANQRKKMEEQNASPSGLSQANIDQQRNTGQALQETMWDKVGEDFYGPFNYNMSTKPFQRLQTEKFMKDRQEQAKRIAQAKKEALRETQNRLWERNLKKGL